MLVLAIALIALVVSSAFVWKMTRDTTNQIAARRAARRPTLGHARS